MSTSRIWRAFTAFALVVFSVLGALAMTTVPATAGIAAAAPVTFGPFHIVNRHSGKCLVIQNASTENDAHAIQFDCNSTAPFNEDWFLDDLSPATPYYHLRNSHSNRCLAIQNASTATDAHALQFTCDFAPPFNEEWRLVDLRPTDPYFHIVNRHSDKCLVVQNASFDNDAHAIQFPCDFSPPFNEEWQLVSK